MLWTITVILLVLWVLGLVSGAQIGAWVHILLILAVVSLIFAVLRRGTGAAASAFVREQARRGLLAPRRGR